MPAGLDLFYKIVLLYWILSNVRQCRRLRSKIRIFSTNKYGIRLYSLSLTTLQHSHFLGSSSYDNNNTFTFPVSIFANISRKCILGYTPYLGLGITPVLP